ncbi:MAG: methyl-accepting chemotaxis protein [Bacteroidales bacterium]
MKRVMEPKQNVSLKSQLGLITGIIVFITVAVLTTFFIINSRKKAIASSKDEIRLMALNSAQTIEKKINETLIRIDDNIAYSLFLKETPGDHREKLYSFYKSEIVNNPSIQGISLVYAPGKFDNLEAKYAGIPGYYTDGRLCIYWYRSENEILRETEVVNFEEELKESGAEWWEIPFNQKELYLSMDIYKWKGKDILMLSIYKPIFSGDEVVGVMGYDFQSDFMQTEAIKIKDNLFEGKSLVNIVSEDGIFAANTLSDSLILKNIKDYYPSTSGLVKELNNNGEHDFFTENDTLFLSTKVNFTGYDKHWLINIAIPESVMLSEVNTQLIVQLIAGVILILLSVILITVFIGRLIKPLINLTNISGRVAEGNLQVEIPAISANEIGKLSGSFRMMVEKIKEIIIGIRQASDQINSGSMQVSDSAQIIAGGASKQASATEQVASSIEQMITAIKQNADNAEQARLIAKKAEKGIVESQQASMSTVDFMKKIADKTSIITEIAQQTNILAINAAIEAARAGSMGKGFGIVAAEVRNLAERSHQAANEIVELSEESLKMSELSGITLSTIVPDVQKTATLVDEIATASQEQNTGVKQISMAINELNSVTLQNTATSEELASSSEELVAQAKLLEEAIAFFTIETSRGKAPEITSKTEEMKELTGFKKPVTETKKEIPFKEKSTPAKGFDLNLDTKHDDEFEAF